MRFRTRGIGIVADIEKALFQIGLQPKKKECLTIFTVQRHKETSNT